MDLTPPSNFSSEKADTQLRQSNKSNRNYRTKKRDESDDNEDILDNSNDNGNDLNKESTPSASSTSSTSPYVQSQNSQSLGQVYPGLSRLSFVDQEEESQAGDNPLLDNGPGSLGAKKPHRPLQQSQSQTSQLQGSSESIQDSIEITTTTSLSSSAVKFTSGGIPPANSPSILSSIDRSGPNLIEIKDTGLPHRGRGLYSASSEILKPGTLVFRELGYCQVVNDASLSKVCSACFKDVREETGEDEGGSSVSSGDQRKLVRCAGCHVTWYCNKTCQAKDWKLHHQLECEGIRKSKTNPATAEIWTKRTFDTTTARAISRMIRRRERVKTSAAYQAKNGKPDPAQKQVNDVYFSGLDEKEERWLDEQGYSWIEQYLPSNEKDLSEKGALKETGKLAKTMALVISCVTGKEDRNAYFNGAEDTNGTKGSDLYHKLSSYGFSITNLETTATIGLALFLQCIPFMNHSCVPNCIYTFKGSRIECRVIREVQPGEELTISYIDQIDTTKIRQEQLKERYQFTCDCPLCKYYPANPLVRADEEPLKDIIPGTLSEPILDPKQGFICPNPTCNGPIVAIESQLTIYNKVEIKCKECGKELELTQETVQDNEENAERIISAFIREMNGGAVSGSSKGHSRKFELTKVQASPDEINQNAVPGGMKTAKEPSAQALQYFDSANRLLTGTTFTTSTTGNTLESTEDQSDVLTDQDVVRHSKTHYLVRRLEQSGFDEAVSHKNWIFALRRSIELEKILSKTYVGCHPVKTIQSYYTCKIANLLANLLLEESTIQIEDSEPEEEIDDDEMLDTDDENELKSWRDAIRKGDKSVKAGAILGSGSMQEQLQKKANKKSKTEISAKNKKEKKEAKRLARTESSKELLQFLKSLIPKLEDPRILQEFRICWGKDGKFASRYRYQIDSLKQALHYAELPFAKPQEE